MSAQGKTLGAPRRRMLSVVALGAAAVALFSTLVPLQTVFYGTPLLVAMPLIAGLSVASLLTLAYPRVAIVVFCVSVVGLPFAVTPHLDPTWPWPWPVPAVIAAALFIFVITFLRGWRTGLAPWGVAMIGTLLAPVILPGIVPAEASTANLIVAASITGAAFLIAMLMASRTRVVAELTRSEKRAEAEQSKRVLIEERTRIARELHDVVAHSMSVIQVQASTARYRIGGLPDAAIAEYEDIASTARSSLAEMRRLLGVLRTDDQQAPQLTPQQGIDDIPALVDSMHRAGAEVRLSLPPLATPPPQSVQLTAFRIVQEALSNAVRHAPGAAITVEVSATDAALMIRVHNDPPEDTQNAGANGGHTEATPATLGGHGLPGMQERVALLAGHLLAGPDPAGGWTVTAILPTTDAKEQRP